MKTFATRSDARAFRSEVNAKALKAGSTAKLKDAVKVTRGGVTVWTLPEECNHGGKLSLKRG